MKKIILGMFLLSSLAFGATYIKADLIGVSAELTKSSNEMKELEYGFGVRGGVGALTRTGFNMTPEFDLYAIGKFNMNIQGSDFKPYVALKPGFVLSVNKKVQAGIYPGISLGVEYQDKFIVELGYPGIISAGVKF